MDLDFLYGGHDLGAFNVVDGHMQPLIQDDMQKIDPTPIWILYNVDSIIIFIFRARYLYLVLYINKTNIMHKIFKLVMFNAQSLTTKFK